MVTLWDIVTRDKITKIMQNNIAKTLLKIEAVKLSPSKPFTWASGWHSPIYCDNRKILSFPDDRNAVGDSFAEVIKANFPEAEIVAGVATGAIAWGVLAAERLNMPAVYVRSAKKDHGMTNQIEGLYKPGQKVVVVEDLISTGGSSLLAVDALRKEGLDVVGMVAIFTYEFQISKEAFENAGVKLLTLTSYSKLIKEAVAEGYVSESQLALLSSWRESPDTWGK